MLKSILLSGFKSYREAELKLAPLTVLIGANASGKSNAVEGLRLLSWIAQGNRLSGIRTLVGGAAVRGTLEGLGYNDTQSFRLGCTVDGEVWDRFEIEPRLGLDGELHVADERITGQGEKVPLYEVRERLNPHGNDIRVAYNNFARGQKPQVVCNDAVAVLHQLESAARFEGGHKTAQSAIPKACGRFRTLLSEVLFLDPQPSTMRGYSHRTEQRLNSDGSNLSAILYRIARAETDGTEDILRLVRSLPEQNIETLHFIETPRQEVMLTLRETFGGLARDRDATVLSDGTLRVLAIAAAILSAPEGSFVVIEEIDNGIHPSRAKSILHSISEIAKARNLNVLISSHNPALLDALPDSDVPNVVFCYRDPDDGSSRLVRLEDVPDYPELIAQGTLGDLLTEGVIDRFVKNHPGAEAKKQLAIDWLARLRAEVG
jgi:hypothetical protein